MPHDEGTRPSAKASPAEIVASVERLCRKVETPCGAGAMVWRLWGKGPPLVLLHGGYGSWTHWLRNVEPLSRRFTVIAPDMPGLGDSASPPAPYSAASLAAIMAEGLDRIVPPPEAVAMAGFSFGAVMGGVSQRRWASASSASCSWAPPGWACRARPWPIYSGSSRG